MWNVSLNAESVPCSGRHFSHDALVAVHLFKQNLFFWSGDKNPGYIAELVGNNSVLLIVHVDN